MLVKVPSDYFILDSELLCRGGSPFERARLCILPQSHFATNAQIESG